MVLLLSLMACSKQAPVESEIVDPRSIVMPPEGVPDDTDTDLHLIRGLSGLLGRGYKGQLIDEKTVLVYGHGSREAMLRMENVEAGRSSLARWLDAGKGNQTVQNGRYLRVPDLDDETGWRFYYFERTSHGKWEFRAICVDGPWINDPKYPPTCDLTYPLNKKILSIRVSEPIFKSESYDTLRMKVVETLTKAGAGD